MQVITVWAAVGENEDHPRGDYDIGYFSTQNLARIAAQGNGYYGRDGKTQMRPAIKDGDKVWLLAQPNPIDVDLSAEKRSNELYAKILASLSPEELQVLRDKGLPDIKDY